MSNSVITISSVICCFYYDPDFILAKIKKIEIKLNLNMKGVIVINNAKYHGRVSDHGDWMFIDSDNSDLDFSAYIDGLSYIKNNEQYSSNGLTLFLNDSVFRNKYFQYHMRQIKKIIPFSREIKAPLIVGKLDKYRSICLQNPWSSLEGYISTYFFLLNEHSYEFLLNVRILAKNDGLYSINSDEGSVFDFSSDFPPCFKIFLLANVLIKNSPILWEGIKNDQSLDFSIKKTRCIYFEHRLSGMIGKSGAIIPINSSIAKNSVFYIQSLMKRYLRKVNL